MIVIYLILYVVILQVEASEKLKICVRKKHKLNDVKQAELLFGESFLMEMNDEINIPGNFSTHLDIEDLISADVSASNIKISGLHNFSMELIPIVLTMNQLKIQGDNYQIQGAITDLFDIYGDGKFEINLEQVSFKIKDIGIAWPLGCFKVNVTMALHEMKAKFDNIMGGDDLLQPVMNKIIGDIGPDLISHYWLLIYDALQPIIQKILDNSINKVGMENSSMIQLGNKTVLQDEYIGKLLEILSDVLYTHVHHDKHN